MELWQYYRILRKRKWLIIIGTFLCVGLVVAATHFGPDRYQAHTTIMEKMTGDDKVVIFTPSSVYQFDPKLRLANLAQLVKSRTVLDRSSETLSRLGISSEPQRILQTLEVSQLLDTTMLTIKVKSESDKEALATANVVTSEFVKYYNELNYGGAVRSKQFIARELPKAGARLARIRQELKNFKEANGVVQLDHQTDMLLQELSQIKTNLAQYEIQDQQAKAKVMSLEGQLRQYPETRTMQKVISSNPVWQTLEIELAKQQIELQKMLRTRTEEHPDVQATRQQIAETQRKLKEVGTTILNSTTEGVDPTRQNLLQNYVSARVESAAGDAACSAASQVVSSLESQMETLPEKEMRLAQLTMEEDRAKNTYSLLQQKLDEASIKEKEAENVSSIQIVDTAKTEPADTNKGMKLILAIVLSPTVCIGVVFLLNYLDNAVKTPAEVEALLGLPVFAAVPASRSYLLTGKKHSPMMDSAYQMLSSNLWIGSADMESHTVLIASAEPDVGRSITAANLAVSLAKDGARVILVDSDLRQPAQHVIFKVDNEKGLSNVLAGQLAIADALKPTSVNDLLIMPSGPIPANPVRLFRSEEMGKFVKMINDLADFVIFDSPAGITFADSTLLAALVKNVVMVYAAGTVPRGAEVEFRKRLDQVEANTLGVVLSMVNPEDSHGFYHFRVGYEDLLRDGKLPSAVSDRILQAIPGESDDSDDTDRT